MSCNKCSYGDYRLAMEGFVGTLLYLVPLVTCGSRQRKMSSVFLLTSFSVQNYQLWFFPLNLKCGLPLYASADDFVCFNTKKDAEERSSRREMVWKICFSVGNLIYFFIMCVSTHIFQTSLLLLLLLLLWHVCSGLPLLLSSHIFSHIRWLGEIKHRV